MKGLNFHERFILVNNLKTALIVFVVYLGFIAVYAGVSFSNKAVGNHSYGVFVEGSSDVKLLSFLKEKNLTVTKDSEPASVKIKISNRGKQLVADINLNGVRKQEQGEVVSSISAALDKYKDFLVKENIKKYNLEQEIYKPLVVNYEGDSNVKSESDVSIIMIPFMAVFFVAVTFLYSGVVEERKSKSLWTLLMAGTSTYIKVLTMFVYRILIVVVVLSLIFILPVMLITLPSKALAIFITILGVLNISLIMYVGLLVSMRVNLGLYVMLATSALGSSLFAGFSYAKYSLFKFIPLCNSIVIAKNAHYINITEGDLAFSFLSNIAFFIILTLIGKKMLESEKILESKVL